MAKAARLGDTCSAHGCFPPTPVTSGSGNVLINGLPAARVSDSAAPHGCGKCPPHGRSIAAGSATVFINGRPAARVGDTISCGGNVATGSDNVLIGDSAGLPSAAASMYADLIAEVGVSGTGNENTQTSSRKLDSAQKSAIADPTRSDTTRSSRTSENAYPTAETEPTHITEQTTSAVASLSSPAPNTEENIEPEPFAAGFIWNTQVSTQIQLYKEHYGRFNSDTWKLFKQANSHLGSDEVLPGELIIFANAPVTQADQAALDALQAQAKSASQGIQQLTPEEAHTVVQHFTLLDAVNSDQLANSSAAVGVSTAVVGQRMTDLQQVLVNIQQNYLDSVEVVNGKARFTQGFYTRRAMLFRQLDNSLNRLTFKAIDIPVSPKVKHTLQLSSKSLLHNWDEIAATGTVPQLGDRINTVARVAKGAKRAGYIGIALDFGVSANAINKACFELENDQCELVTYKEGGRFIGSTAGGYAGAKFGGSLAVGAAGTIALAVGVTLSWPVIAIVGVTGVAVGAYGGSSLGGSIGEGSGELLYKYFN
ncbi:MAG: PAAR domain-containing protein [Amphritea sp.]|nr:PAAR domain-containing protein [Amphritea sp.]